MSIDKRDFQRAVDLFEPTQPAFDGLVRRRRLRERRRRLGAGVAAVIVIALAAALIGRSFETTTPADHPPSQKLQAMKPGIWIVDPVSNTIRFVWGASWLDTNARTTLLDNMIGAPTLSPNGDRIAFAGNRGSSRYMWTVSSSGQDLREVCGPDSACLPAGIGPGVWQSWSRDGRSLLFAGGPNSQQNPSDIYAVNTDGTGFQRLESMPGEEDVADWSPSGKRIVFDHEGGIYIASLDGGSPIELVKRGNMPSNMPIWSPDGQWIAFLRFHGRSSTIWVVHPDGTGAHVLADGYWAVGWSPDGSHLAVFESGPSREERQGIRRYAIVDVATGASTTIEVNALNSAQLLFDWSSTG
jgi:Tol biopolymer transport system component